MPPKKRSTSNSKSQTKPKSSSDEKTPSTSEQTAQGEQEEGERRRRGSKVKWSPVFKRIGYISLIFIIPAILNYAALNQEARMLVPKGTTIPTNGHSLCMREYRFKLVCMQSATPDQAHSCISMHVYYVIVHSRSA